MQQEVRIELILENKMIEQRILLILQEIIEGTLVDSNDILEDLNPLMSQLSETDKNQVIYALNRYFRDHEFLRNSGYWLQGNFNPQEEAIDYTIVYNTDRETNNYESILENMKVEEFRRQNLIPVEFAANLQSLINLKIKSLLVFDLLDFSVNRKDLTQIEILKILLELFYCTQTFADNESQAFEQLIGSLLQKQIFEIAYYIQIIKNNDPHNYKNFVQLLQQLQLKIINENNYDLQAFLEKNQRYRVLFNTFSKEMIHIRSQLLQFIGSLIQIPVEQCYFLQILSYINNIENVNDQLNDLYLLIVFYFWKKYCFKYNLYLDLKNQEDSLTKIIENDRKFKLIERYLTRQKSNLQDKIYLFVIHKICYFVEEIENLLFQDTYSQFIKTMNNNLKIYKEKKQFPIKIYMQDKSKFLEYWKMINLLKFYQQEIQQYKNQFTQLITNLFWINNQTISMYNILNMITSNENKSFLELVQLIEDGMKEINLKKKIINYMDFNILKINFLRIVYSEFPEEENNYLLLRSLIENYGSLLRASMTLQASQFINQKLNSESIQFFVKIGKKLIVIHKIFPPQTLSKLANEILDYITSDTKVYIYDCLLILESIFAIKQVILSEDLQLMRILTKNFCPNILGYLIIINKNQNISLTQVKWTIYAIFNLFQKLDQFELIKVEKYINKVFKDQCYNFPFVFNCLRNQINFQKINKTVQLQYSLCFNQSNKLVQLSQELFQLDEQLYEQWFKTSNPPQVMLSIEYLKVAKSQSYYPKQMDIPLEDFNISLSEYCEQEQKQVLSNWIQKMTDTYKFKQIIPLYFNIIKRGESPYEILIYANQILQNYKMFQFKIIILNNANDELRVILMKFFSKEYPIPFLYQNPIMDNLKFKTEILLLNSNLFYFIEQGYTIINFSLSQNQKKIGKTELINQIFYEREKFETSDTCQMNQNTIDIMFDFEFNNSRSFILADVHGTIIFEILIKILPFFQFWIVQMDSEKELQENLDQISIILQKIEYQIIQKLEICFIVRNTEERELMNNQPINYEIENKNIKIFYLHNLTANQIDKQFKISQIQDVSKFLFNLILDHQKRLYQGNQYQENLKNQFLLVLQQFNPQYNVCIQQIINHQNLINQIQDKLNGIVNEQDGFYSQNAFPIRRIQWNMKKLRNQNYELCMKPIENKMEIEKNKKQIEDQEIQIQKQNPTELLKIFCEIFKQKQYYIVYLQIVDKIRQFNEKNLINLQQKDYELNEQFNKLKQEKHKIKQKYLNNLQNLCEDQFNKTIKDKMSKLKQQMDNNALNISKKNVGIELFWRELISLRKSNNYDLEFNPVETLSELIRKGESLEFLDGDTLSINTQFLFDLENKITQNKQQKILVISILGPQSSGKSTILNKIFGCHFWASVGRCTKGIHLQILQVQNKQVFQNRFDQILILDTEGLQNPNQIDFEFDKKIALFVLSISDIIMINVKGEINQQFKSLVEMCIFTLGHLKNGFSMVKQLSWFFNQNDNYKNVQPFKQQIKDLAQNLNLYWNENYYDQQEEHIDYADILDIKDNISGLGFASDQKDWGKNGWNQSVNNPSFSREAYKQGISMIKQFISKIQDQKDPLSNFNHFLQNVQRNWESIEKLPDLLEFSELIQHQQNLIMNKYFDTIWKTEDISSVGENIIEVTNQKIKIEKQIVFDSFKQIQIEQENDMQQTFSQSKTKIEEKMNSFKSENKIQKKIIQKYQMKLENLIKSQELDCKIKIQTLIQKYEGKYQKKKGYVQIDNFIQTVLNDEKQKKNFEGNEKLIEQEFQKKWEQYINETNKTLEQQYLVMVDTQYKALKSISNEYILKTKNESEYFYYFRDVLIKQNPYDNQNTENENIFQLFQRELRENEQFICINNHNRQNQSYLDIFHQKIQEKLEKSKDQLIDMKSFYSQQIQYSIVAKVDIQEYLNSQFEQDFDQFLRKYENHTNIGTHFYNFLSFLDYLQISHDKKSKQQLDNIINNYSNQQQIKQLFINKRQQLYQAFEKLKKSLFSDYNANQEIDLSGKTFGQTFMNTYQGLKISQKKDQSWNNTQSFKKELLQQNIIINTQNDIFTSENSYQESFNFIKSPQSSFPAFFRSHFPKQFNKIMINQKGWNKLYNEFYNLIQQEMSCQIRKVNNNKEDENIQSFNPYLITGIMKKVENSIKVKYNNYFAQFGVILTDVGERCIYYYSMLIIWRFLCYQRQNSKNIQQKHQNNYQNELNRCIAEINQDNQKQSCIKAREFVNKIQKTLKKQYLDRIKQEVLQKINKMSMSNFQLVEKLDKELLIDVDEKTFEDQQYQQKIQFYTTDHKSYINKYVQDMLAQFQFELFNEYSNKYKQELSQYLKCIQDNAKILYKYVENQKKDVKSFQYFNEQNHQKKNKINYEKLLFRLFLQCLHGKIEDKIDIIEDQYKEIFQVSNYNPINGQLILNLELLNSQDQQVYNLKTFVQTFIESIDIIFKNKEQILLKQDEYELDVEFGKIKFQLNGCEYTCPCCNRKCDQDNDSIHTHQCQNGHQIRGINGILITKDSPSLFTCQEILDECTIITLETNLKRTWKAVKKAHSNWNFKNLFKESNDQNINKWKNVWNRGLGKLICQHLAKQLNHQIIFSQKQEIHIQVSNFHYILILDDSYSMFGNKWSQAKEGALNCIKSLENTDSAKVSVIIFNNNARIVAECQKPNFQEMNNKIVYSGGGTCFEPPFKLALKLIKKYHNFNKIQILFYTDGEASYPQNAVDKLCQLQQDIRRLISITACSGEKYSQQLALLIEKFQQYMQSAELKNSVEPIELQEVWTEVVSQNIHHQLA